MNENSTHKVYLIARVSTDDQYEALPGQVFRLREYAERNAYRDAELKEFVESAYKVGRSKFNEFLNNVRIKKEPFILVFDKIDRYTRDSSSEEVQIMKRLYRSGQLELHFPSDNLRIHMNSPAADLMRLGMGEVVSQYYSDAISDNVKRRLEQKLRDGEWIGKAPFGYKNTILPNNKKWVEINANEAEVVRKIFELYSSGVQSLRSIKKTVREEFALELSVSKLEIILKNPFHYGEMRVKGNLYPHKYDTLITFELYKQAEAVRNGYKIKPRHWAGLPFTYRGQITCSECGCMITFEIKKKRYIYGHCTQYRGKHSAHYIRESDITEQLMNVFRAINIPQAAFDEINDTLKASHEEKKKTRLRTLSVIDTEIEKYQKRIDKVYEDHLDEKITYDLYKRKSDEYRAAQKTLQNKRKNIDDVEDDYLKLISNLLRLAKDGARLFETASIEQKRSMLGAVLSNLQLDGKQLRWELKKPFETMVFCNEMNSWLRIAVSNLSTDAIATN